MRATSRLSRHSRLGASGESDAIELWAVLFQRVDPVQDQHVQMHVEIERTAETLNGIVVEWVPLVAGLHEHGHRSFRLQQLGPDEWRMHNHRGAMPPDFYFLTVPADEARLDRTCAKLQSDPASMFRRYLVCQRMTEPMNSGITWSSNMRPTSAGSGTSREWSRACLTSNRTQSPPCSANSLR